MKTTSAVALFALTLFAQQMTGCGSDSAPTQPPDRTPPAVLSTAPTDTGYLDSLNRSVRVVFTDPMQPTSLTPATFWIDGAPGTVACTNDVATFTPTTPFDHQTTYTAHVAASVRDLAGNALGAEYTWTFTTRDWQLAKVAAVKFGLPEATIAVDVKPTSDGNFVLTGLTGQEGNWDAYLAKVTPAGLPIWQRALDFGDAEHPAGVVQTLDGGFVVAGTSGLWNSSGLLFKTDGTGALLWSTVEPTTAFDGITLDADGGLLVFGSAHTTSLVRKYSSVGLLQWAAAPDSGYVMGVIPDGDGYRYASRVSTVVPGPGEQGQLWIGRLDALGQPQWRTKLWQRYAIRPAGDLVRLPADRIVVVGGSMDATGNRQPLAFGLDADSTVLWSHAGSHNYREFQSGLAFRDVCLAITPGLPDFDTPSLIALLDGAGNAQQVYGPSAWLSGSSVSRCFAGTASGDDLWLAGSSAATETDAPEALFLHVRWW